MNLRLNNLYIVQYVIVNNYRWGLAKKKKQTIQFYPQYYSKKKIAYFCLTLELVVLEMQNSADQLEEKIKTKTIKKRIYLLTRKLIYNVPNLLGELQLIRRQSLKSAVGK